MIESNISTLVTHLKDTHVQNYLKFNSINRLLKFKDIFKELKPIYIVTPTFTRPTQFAEFTRLKNTLQSVPKVFWIVVEDSDIQSKSLNQFLKKSGIPFMHLNIKFVLNLKGIRKRPGGNLYHKTFGAVTRGSQQRNFAINWLKNNINNLDPKGSVYFGDDDNSYHLRLFEEVKNF